MERRNKEFDGGRKPEDKSLERQQKSNKRTKFRARFEHDPATEKNNPAVQYESDKVKSKHTKKEE